MILTCIRPFGNFLPGDEVEVPEGSVFDRYYFAAKPRGTKPRGKGTDKGND